MQKNKKPIFNSAMVLAVILSVLALNSCSNDAAGYSGDSAANNKAIIEKGFKDWVNGVGNLFPLVADSVKWTIENYSERPDGYISEPRVYHSKKELMKANMKSLYSRFTGIIKPEVKGVYADGDMVVVYWQGTTQTTEKLPFSNTYVWIMRMKNGKVTELTAFLDMNVMNKLMKK